jgi:hypothetical protein
MLNDPPPLETAEEKAQRKWRNNSILDKVNKLNQIERIPVNEPSTVNESILRKFKRDIREMLLHNPREIITKYILSIQSRKNRLLKEKLRRLELMERKYDQS